MINSQIESIQISYYNTDKISINFMYYDKFIIKINRIDNKSIISVYYDKFKNLIFSLLIISTVFMNNKKLIDNFNYHLYSFTLIIEEYNQLLY
jgi:hypothetical protein